MTVMKNKQPRLILIPRTKPTKPFNLYSKGGIDMYALIYDESDPAKREKKVVSVHKTRETA